jgi:hypothetical protein
MIAEIGTSHRQRALNVVLPAWLERRREAQRTAGELADAQTDHTAALHDLAEAEEWLAHVTQCQSDPCLRCEALDGPVPSRGVLEECR